MINSLKQAITDKLTEIYPAHTVYDEEIPETIEGPVFLIALTKQDYKKRMNNKYKSIISFDIAYYSDKPTTDVKVDFLNAQRELFRAFDLISTFRVLNKQANIKENILHFTFDISYCEMTAETEPVMQSQTTTTNL
ncbi:phage tail terminator family protein [Clostridium aminobutyricum]|uniref:Uncharacterized protein n=1 Tax=Clostridium aminobutyricum TaxID=33953 RepID=A0A939D8M2_CLOAM|nr:hypothetical protein [Clostridium aminobutyricum]MBN7773151.1 hypothetical protein [Clostridium aminobutyricum]